MKTFGLRRKKIFVSGVDGFLGKFIQDALTEEGALVIGTDIKQSTNAHELNIGNTENVTDYADLQSELDVKFDGIVNNAAVSFRGLHTTDEQFDKTMAVNIKGTYNCMTKFKPILTENASIVNIASIYGLISPNFDLYEGNEQLYSPAIYGATKAAIVQMTKYYAVQYAPIRVNAVSPGGIFQGHDEQFTSRYARNVPLRRMANPEEIVNTIMFLLSPLSSYITGQNIVVDGGMSIW